MKKILKRILYFLLGLFALLCAFVLFCAFHPDVTNTLADFLYPDRMEKASVEQKNEQEESNRAGVLPEHEAREMKEVLAGTENPDIDYEESNNQGIQKNLRTDYIPPEQSNISVPGNLLEKTGFQPVREEREELEEKAAEELTRQLGVGNTGDGLSFDPLYYPYYAMLDDKGQHIYRQIYANANDIRQSFAPVEAVTAGELKHIFEAVYNDHPDLFWLETAYSGKYRRNGQCVEIDLRFNRTVQNLEAAKAAFTQNANTIIAGARGLGSAYEKEVFVHDAIIDKVTYDLNAEMNQSAYSALVNGQTVCAGYARAFQYIMQQLQIPCYYCTGFAGEAHAWNIIYLQDGYYNVDTTWDDADRKTYNYFNKTDNDYAGTHVRQDLSVYLPPCNGEMYRNLEQNDDIIWEESAGEELRSIEDVGISEDEILYTLADYYTDCYNQMVQRGSGSYIFSNVIQGEALLEEWYEDYLEKGFWTGYMENAVLDSGCVYSEIYFVAEPLQGDRYLISHVTEMW